MKPEKIALRGAFTVTELLVALALLSTAIGLSSMLMTRMLTARAVSQAKMRAWSAAENVMEEVSSRPWEALPAGRLELPQAAAEVAAVVPDGALEVQVVEVAAPVPSRRIDVTVQGTLPSGFLAPLVRLSTWVFPPPRELAPAAGEVLP